MGCKMKKSGQSVIEYFVVFTVILAAILASGIISPNGGKISHIFQGYFNQAVAQMR